MAPSARCAALALLWLLTFRTTPCAAPSVYETDMQFALTELETRCGKFFDTKRISWKKVSRQFRKEARVVRTPQDHLVLLVRLLARLKDGHAAVRPLEQGKNVRWPDATDKNNVLPGMFLCRSGKKLLVKQSWGAAAAAGLRPGMELLQLDGRASEKWLKQRTEQVTDLRSFSTTHQALFYTTHWGLADLPGTALQLTVKTVERKRGRVTLSGRGIEGIGVLPHETIPYAAKDLAKGIDSLTARAVRHLEQFPAKEVPYQPAEFGWRPTPPTEE